MYYRYMKLNAIMGEKDMMYMYMYLGHQILYLTVRLRFVYFLGQLLSFLHVQFLKSEEFTRYLCGCSVGVGALYYVWATACLSNKHCV